MTRLKNIQMTLCIPLTMTSFLFGDKAKTGSDKLDEDFQFFILQIYKLVLDLWLYALGLKSKFNS